MACLPAHPGAPFPAPTPTPSRTRLCSKTFTTAETMLNARTVRAWLTQHLGAEAVGKHMIAVRWVGGVVGSWEGGWSICL